jgi:hypothetical protein
MSHPSFARTVGTPLLVTLALFGAGCALAPDHAAQPTTSTPPATINPAPSTTNTQPLQPSPEPSTTSTDATSPSDTTDTTSTPSVGLGGSTELTPSEQPDETWKKYANPALNFHFFWPTKGRYAPEWEVKFVKPTDAALKDGCYTGDFNDRSSARTVRVSNTEFCHTHFSDGAAGSNYLTDYFTTKMGNQYVLIQFSKHLYSAGALDCKDFLSGYSTSPTSCVEFKDAEYTKQLEQIISTFKEGV